MYFIVCRERARSTKGIPHNLRGRDKTGSLSLLKTWPVFLWCKDIQYSLQIFWLFVLILIAFGQFRCLSYFFFFPKCAGLLLLTSCSTAQQACSLPTTYVDYYFKALGEVSVAVHLHIALPLTHLILKCQKSWGAFKIKKKKNFKIMDCDSCCEKYTKLMISSHK